MGGFGVAGGQRTGSWVVGDGRPLSSSFFLVYSLESYKVIPKGTTYIGAYA